VAGEFLRDGGVAGVLKRAGDELVADRVPRQTLATAVIETGESKQLTPHPLEVLDRPAVLRAKHVRFGFTLQRKPPLDQLLFESFGAGVDVFDLPRRLASLADGGWQGNLQHLNLFAFDFELHRPKVDMLQLDLDDFAVAQAQVKRRVQPASHLVALGADLVLARIPDLALHDLAAEAGRDLVLARELTQPRKSPSMVRSSSRQTASACVRRFSGLLYWSKRLRIA
jgi:hypothetical protein